MQPIEGGDASRRHDPRCSVSRARAEHPSMTGKIQKDRVATVLAAGAAVAALAACSAASAAADALPRSSPERQGVSSARLGRLEARYRTGVEAGEIPGAVVMIARNGRLIYDRALGFSDRAAAAPMPMDAVFALASMSKPITSVAAMTLVEEGKLSLDEPISRYLPEFANLKVAVEKPGADGKMTVVLEPPQRQPTVQDLMRHTSGFIYGQFGDGPLHRSYIQAKVLDPTAPLSEMMARLAKLPLAHQPGSTFEYSVSTDVLGRIVEVVANEPLDSYVARRITGPLRMNATGFRAPEGATFAWSDDVAAESRRALRSQLSRTPAGLSGGGGMYGAAGDYLRFAQMLLNGGELDGVRILGPKTVQLMTSNQLAPDTVVAPNSASLLRMLAPTPQMGQGFGLGFATRLSPGRNPSPGSVGDFYWAGSSGTYFWVDPAERLVVVILTAQPKPDIKVLYRQLARQLVYQALTDIAPSGIDQLQTVGAPSGPAAGSASPTTAP